MSRRDVDWEHWQKLGDAQLLPDFMINRERVELLCQALESDEFRDLQGDGRLYDPATNTYCCLGVATVVAERAGLVPSGLHYPYGSHSLMNHPDGEVLHLDVMEWYGFDEQNPDLIITDSDPDYGTTNMSASDANDRLDINEHVFTFLDIAAAFRRTYLGQEVSP